MIDIFFSISATDWSTILRNYMTIVTLMVGAYVALKGLDTWKDQLDHNENRNLAKSIASHIYHIRTIYNDVRDNEYSDKAYLNKSGSIPDKDYSDLNVDQEFARIEEKLIAADNVKAKLYPLTLEAELLWGNELVTRIDEYFKKLSEIQRDLYLRRAKLRRPFRNEKSWKKQWSEIEDIEDKIFLYSNSIESQDLSISLQSKFDRVAEYLRSKIGTTAQ